ncbi:MAG: N-acetyltransferase [Acidobacteriota bacterium]|nr:N-acetyltransferase [Acidobacteriota bacterium]
MENLQVIDNKEKERFEIDLDGKTALIDYSEQNGVVAMTHTEVPAEFEGKGVGSRLVKGALEIVKNDGKRVRPLCTFVAAYIKRHPEYESLVV